MIFEYKKIPTVYAIMQRKTRKIIAVSTKRIHFADDNIYTTILNDLRLGYKISITKNMQNIINKIIKGELCD